MGQSVEDGPEGHQVQAASADLGEGHLGAKHRQALAARQDKHQESDSDAANQAHLNDGNLGSESVDD